jgi:hypothetical protein
MCTIGKNEPEGASSSSEDVAALNAAFDFLYGGLRDAKKLFDTGDKGSREGAIHALEILLKFLSRFQPVLDQGLNAPLIALFNALLSLNDGNVLPMLKPVPPRGRSRASGIRDSLRGAAAFTVTRLCATGRSAPDAHADVARTVRGWCEEVAADIGRCGEAAQTFDLLEKQCPVVEGAEPADIEGAERADIRRAYLDSLKNLINNLRGSEQ